MRLGITGHQQLPNPSGWSWVEKCISNHIETFPGQLTGITSLAIGADQLFASIILRQGCKLYVVIPFDTYESVFDAEHAAQYRHLLRAASGSEVLQPVTTNEEAYLLAGKRVVDLSDEVIAVWDGKPAKGKGGTADIVEYCVYRKKPLFHINPAKQEYGMGVRA